MSKNNTTTNTTARSIISRSTSKRTKRPAPLNKAILRVSGRTKRSTYPTRHAGLAGSTRSEGSASQLIQLSSQTKIGTKVSTSGSWITSARVMKKMLTGSQTRSRVTKKKQKRRNKSKRLNKSKIQKTCTSTLARTKNASCLINRHLDKTKQCR